MAMPWSGLRDGPEDDERAANSRWRVMTSLSPSLTKGRGEGRDACVSQSVREGAFCMCMSGSALRNGVAEGVMVVVRHDRALFF